MSSAFDKLGISQDGIATAMDIKQRYRDHEPLVVPGENERLLVPENLLNKEINLSGLEDPLALAMVSSRDPESPMALAAVARLCPLGNKTPLVRGMMEIIGDTSKHELVKECLKYVTDQAFDTDSIVKIRTHASKIIIESRKQFTMALRQNLTCLLDGDLAPRQFVREFFELTEAGNLRHDIRKKLVLSLLLSPSVRPSIKFLMLENFTRMPKSVRLGIISAVLKAEPSRHTEIIKEELRYILTQARAEQEGHDINGRPDPSKVPGKVAGKAANKVANDAAPKSGFPMPAARELHPARPRPGFVL